MGKLGRAQIPNSSCCISEKEKEESHRIFAEKEYRRVFAEKKMSLNFCRKGISQNICRKECHRGGPALMPCS